MVWINWNTWKLSQLTPTTSLSNPLPSLTNPQSKGNSKDETKKFRTLSLTPLPPSQLMFRTSSLSTCPLTNLQKGMTTVTLCTNTILNKFPDSEVVTGRVSAITPKVGTNQKATTPSKWVPRRKWRSSQAYCKETNQLQRGTKPIGNIHCWTKECLILPMTRTTPSRIKWYIWRTLRIS